MLEYSREFIELAMRLNYTAAAEKLHLSTSALSRHIADLEAELGFTLLNRNPLELTPAGLFYLEKISTLIDDLDRIVKHGRDISALEDATLRIYMLPSKARFADVVYEAAAHMRRSMPGLTTDICVDDRFLTTEEALHQDKADIGVVFDGSISDTEAIATVPFAYSPLCAWVRRDNPLATRASVTLEDLSEYAHPKSTNRQSLTAIDALGRLFDSAGIPLKMHLRNLEDRASFFLTLREDEFMIEFEEDDEPGRVNPDLVRLRFEEPLLRPVILAYRRGSSNPLVGQLVKLCRALAKSQNLPQSDSEAS